MANISEISIASNPTIVSSTISILKPSLVIPIASSSALITSIALLITNEFISQIKIRYVKLRDGIKVIGSLHEKN